MKITEIEALVDQIRELREIAERVTHGIRVLKNKSNILDTVLVLCERDNEYHGGMEQYHEHISLLRGGYHDHSEGVMWQEKGVSLLRELLLGEMRKEQRAIRRRIVRLVKLMPR